MTHDEAIKVFGRVRKLFSDWKPNPEQTKGWVSAIEAIPLMRIGDAAAGILFTTYGFPTPTVEAYLSAVQTASLRAPEPLRTDEGPKETGWVICVENDEMPSRVGYYIPVYVPGQVFDGPVAGEVCDRFASRQARPRAFGGRWASCPGWTHQQVINKSREIREAAGMRPEASIRLMTILRNWLGTEEQK